MRLRLLAPLAIAPLFLIAAPLTGCEQDPAPSDVLDPDVDSTHEEIFGGAVDTANNYRAVVWLYDENGGFSCSGTIIASNGSTAYVLTAGHCTNMTVAAIARDYYDCPQGPGCEAVFSVVPGSQVVHPSYDNNNPQNGYDFSLLRISGASGVPVIPAASSPDGLSVGASAVQVGFGKTQSDPMNSERRFVTVDVDQIYGQPPLIYHNQTDGKGTCSGDSGGPTIFNGHVVGVTSFGDEFCATDGYSGRVSAVYNGFIAPYINAPVTETCDTCFADEVNQPAGQCYANVEACLNDTACSALVDCLNPCTTDACVQACANASTAAAIGKYNAIFDCACTACSTLCAAECANPTTSSGTGSTGPGGLTTSNGSGGASGAGGASGSGGDSSASGNADGETATTRSAQNCNCATPGAPAGSPYAALGLAGAALAMGAMRRRRRG
jgi:MYXO-CTERM domain-containing protein